MGPVVKNRYPSIRAVTTLLFTLLVGAAIATASPRIGYVDTFWKDSIAVIQTQVIDPFREETWNALLSGLPVVLDLEIQVANDDYIQEGSFAVRIKHDVWENSFHVHTPQGRKMISNYPSLIRFFDREFSVFLERGELPQPGPWRVRVRVGEGRILEKERHGIESRLSGIAGRLFRWVKPPLEFSRWSPYIDLPLPSRPEQKR